MSALDTSSPEAVTAETGPSPDVAAEQLEPVVPWGMFETAIVAVVAAVFAPACRGNFVRDDLALVVENPQNASLANWWEVVTTRFWPAEGGPAAGAYRLLWRPVVKLVFLVTSSAFGTDPVGYHVVNLSLHLFVGVTLWFVARELLRSRKVSLALQRISAATVMTFFLLHPSRPEAVTWISGITDLMMMAFVSCAALLAMFRPDTKIGVWVALGLLAFLSKEVVVAQLVLLGVFWRDPKYGKPVRAALAGAFLGIVLQVVWSIAYLPHGSFSSVSRNTGVLIPRVLSTFGHYIVAVVRWQPSLGVPVDPNNPEYLPSSVVIGALGVLLSVVAIHQFWANRDRAWWFSYLWFAVTLGPVMNLMPLQSEVLTSERFLYAPIMGIAWLAGLTAANVGLYLRPALGRVAVASLGLFFVVMAQVTFVRSLDFTDVERLWTAELEHQPDRYDAYFTLAELQISRSAFEEAEHTLQRCLTRTAAVHRSVEQDICALILLRVDLLRTADADVQRLREISAAYEHLAAQPEIRRGGVTFVVPREVYRAVLSDRYRFVHPRLHALMRSGNARRAAELADQAITQAPADAEPYRILALCLAVLNQWQQMPPVMGAIEQRFPRVPVMRDFLLALRDAARLRAQPESVDLSEDELQAQSLLRLGLGVEAARSVENAPNWQARTTSIAIKAQVELLNRDFDAAARWIAEGRRLAPEVADWSVIEGELNRRSGLTVGNGTR